MAIMFDFVMPGDSDGGEGVLSREGDMNNEADEVIWTGTKPADFNPRLILSGVSKDAIFVADNAVKQAMLTSKEIASESNRRLLLDMTSMLEMTIVPVEFFSGLEGAEMSAARAI
jgi:hypothetical protein